jgi:hypothetical protein
LAKIDTILHSESLSPRQAAEYFIVLRHQAG